MDQPVHAGHRQRVKQRFLQEGLSHFERHQIVEMLLFFGIPRRDTNELAHRLMEAFGSLSGVLDAPYEELCRIPGMSENAAVLLCFCKQLAREYAKDQQQAETVLKSYQRMGEYAVPFFAGLEHEAVLLICMDSRYRVRHAGIVTEGSVNAAQINTRLILQTALRHNATAVVLAHNHPGGSAVPSREDVATTQQLRKVLSPAGIALLDHIVVAGDEFMSMHNTPMWAPLCER